MHFKKILILNVLLGLSLVSAATSDCYTPDGKRGNCVSYGQCDFVVELYKKYGSNIPIFFRNFVVNSQCGEESEYKICCEKKISDNDSGVSARGNTINQRGLDVLSSLKCGTNRYTERISFGENVNLAEFPWMALLKYKSEENEFRCGGTLITNYFVLTAKHCITDDLIGVRLGEHNVDTYEDCETRGDERTCVPPAADFTIEKIIPHPDYNSGTIENDAALIKLNRYVRMQKHIRPICLPITDISLKKRTDNRYFISGWGATDKSKELGARILQKGQVSFVEPNECGKIFKRLKITENHICAGGQDKINTCRGDSGGPLFWLTEYNRSRITGAIQVRFIQYGILSNGGTVCGDEELRPAIFTSVADILPWITNVLADEL